MALAPARSLKDLRSLVFRNHALKLEQELILGRGRRRRLEEHALDPMLGKLFDQQDLIGVFPAQPIWRVDQNRMELTLGSQIAHPLEPRALEARPAIAVVFEDQLLGHAVA